jgi:hypothetical protein
MAMQRTTAARTAAVTMMNFFNGTRVSPLGA